MVASIIYLLQFYTQLRLCADNRRQDGFQEALKQLIFCHSRKIKLLQLSWVESSALQWAQAKA